MKRRTFITLLAVGSVAGCAHLSLRPAAARWAYPVAADTSAIDRASGRADPAPAPAPPPLSQGAGLNSRHRMTAFGRGVRTTQCRKVAGFCLSLVGLQFRRSGPSLTSHYHFAFLLCAPLKGTRRAGIEKKVLKRIFASNLFFVFETVFLRVISRLPAIVTTP